MEEPRKMRSATLAMAMAKSEGSKPAMEPASARRSSARPAITRSVRAIQAPMSPLRHPGPRPPRRQLAHDAFALRVGHGRPAGNLRQRPAAAGAESRARVNDAHIGAWGSDWPLHSRRAQIAKESALASVGDRQGDDNGGGSRTCDLATTAATGRPPAASGNGGDGPAVALLSQRLQGRHGAQHPALGQAYHGLGALAQLRAQLERAAMKVDEVLNDGQPQSGAALGGLVCQ